MDKDTSGVKLIVGLVIGVLVLITLLVLNPFAAVGVGERGVVLSQGAYNGKIFEPGWHWRTPIVETVKKVDVTVQKEEVDVAAATKDLQDVSTKVAMNFHVDPTKVGALYQRVRNDYKDVLIAPAMQESVKAATAKFTAEELITKRELVRDEINSLLKDKIEPNGIIIDGFNITNFQFSVSFNKAIESKVTAEQDALASKNKLEQVKYEAQQQIETAKAEAESIRIQAQAINAQGGADYVQLKAIEKWNGSLPMQMIPGSTVPFINLKQ